MNREGIKIRIARPQDAEALLKIYAPYVTDTAITFEYDVPSVQEFADRICKIQKKYPYLAAEEDGQVVGYAYAGAFHARAAYEWAVETSIYVDKAKKGMGIGSTLYEALEKCLSAQGILNLNACIACPREEDEYLTKDSIYFHEHCGYRLVGEFRLCGYKFNRWYNMVWMEKHIGTHMECQPKIKAFDEIRENLPYQ
ncbi:MAG: GNAT family N-acetyltransferase [Eubacteriales bacterium]|nr:GNAT family N-acetyltransferase [Eubacteriales bacterium]